MTPLLGTTSIAPRTSTLERGVATAYAATATAAGTTAELSLYLGAGGTATGVVAGLYADRNGHPGQRLARARVTALAQGAWNPVALDGRVAITAGARYWIAVVAIGGQLKVRTPVPNAGSEDSETHRTLGIEDLPAVWQTGAVVAKGGPLSAYAPAAQLTGRVHGPLWSADVEIAQLADPRSHAALRHLFLDTTPRPYRGADALLPGTMLALCWVRRVAIQPAGASGPAYVWERAAGDAPPRPPAPLPDAELRALLADGRLTLLLATADPAAWAAAPAQSVPDLRCVAGEIALAPLQPQADAAAKLARALTVTADPPAAPSVHAAGLSLRGAIAVPWTDEPLRGPLRLSPELDNPARLRLTSERERLDDAERAAHRRAWAALGTALRPADAPAWVALELVDARGLPRVFWTVSGWHEQPASLPLGFEPSSLALVLSDQRVDDVLRPPTSVARLIPAELTLTVDGEEISIAVRSGPPPGADRLTYAGERTADGWTESWRADALEFAFDAVEVPRALRGDQALPEPEATGPATPAVVWAALPLDDGWAQLPVPNLSEAIYLDAGLARTPVAPPRTLEGAVSYANDTPGASARAAGEQSWRFTLTDAAGVQGSWHLERDAAGGLALADVALDVAAPDVTLEGLCWVATEAPATDDALPRLDDFVGGLRPLVLRTIRPERDPFPPLVVTRVAGLRFGLRAGAGFPAAALGEWELEYAADPVVLAKLVAAGTLTPHVFAAPRALLWRRHATLPMVQALPLTQSRTPPNAPSASRQLAPYELAANADGLPVGWRFGAGGADRWPAFRGPEPVPAREWAALDDLPLTALSLAGLVLAPGPASLRAGYRFDLPYADELHALAQLPRVESAAPAPALTRERLAAHWLRLNDRAALAAADAVSAFADGDGAVRDLIEPLEWPVTRTLHDAAYPGALELVDRDTGHRIELKDDTALAGIGGTFGAVDGRLRLLGTGEPAVDPYEVSSGSMAARRDGAAFADQRGLRRGASQGQNGLVVTPVELAGQAGAYELATALEPLALAVDNGRTWRFWFRDLPLRDDVFERAATRSDRNQDVNDPEALGREHNHLEGYEWRLATDGPLTLFGLHLHPLTLERVERVEGAVASIEIIGRLQLPLEGHGEDVDVVNAVRVHFARGVGGLALASVTAADGGGEWPLARRGGELSDAPRVRWNAVALAEGGAALRVLGATLRALIFGLEWEIPLGQLELRAGDAIERRVHTEPSLPGEQLALTPAEAVVRLDAASGRHAATFLVGVRLARDAVARPSHNNALRWRPGPGGGLNATEVRSAFAAEIRYDLVGGDPVCESAWALDDLTLDPAAVELVAAAGALQLTWADAEGRPQLQLLPGMHLSPAIGATGFAALTFSVARAREGSDVLVLESAFAETALAASWGTSLVERSGAELGADELLRSSAGDIVAGYTGRWAAGWQDGLVLTGLLELRNLVSWPLDAGYDPQRAVLKLPAAAGAAPLSHIRHSARVLLNQHELPPALLELGSGTLLFDIARELSWQPLAVVEHQFVDATCDAALTGARLENDRRFTAVQEVRFMSPAVFARALTAHGAAATVDPVRGGAAPIGDVLSGALDRDVRALLIAELQRLPAGALVVDASAAHWISQRPLESADGGLPAAATLQVLPQGSLTATLSSPADYAPTAHGWLLLATPCLGRLQDRAHDDDPAGGPLQVDPVRALQRARTAGAALPALALALATWAGAAPAEIDVSAFDAAVGRTLARLDPVALEAGWLRLQSAPPAREPVQLVSVIVSETDTPVRLARPDALARAFVAELPGGVPPADPSGDPVWRPHALAAAHAVAGERPPQGWYGTAVTLLSSALGPSTAAVRRYAAATALPAWFPEHARPTGLVVSPYGGLALQRRADETVSHVLVAELLGLDPAAGELRPVAGRTLEPAEDAVSPRPAAVQWARETHPLLAPDSPIAVVRLREVVGPAARAARGGIATVYGFAGIPDLVRPPALATRGFALRSPVERLRHQEGQYGPGAPPVGLRAFEAAAPQVAGVQPLRLAVDGRPWPFGLSALRYSVRYGSADRPAIGGLDGAGPLWWQAPAHAVQFRRARAGRPVAGLPARFRAASIAALLPVVPAPPMPALPATDWQPVLPGSLRQLVIGARAGTMLALRHSLLRQDASGVVVSGSVPVAHRVPRPLPLPPNDETARATALRTWAGHFAPTSDAWISAGPSDDAFYADPGGACGLRLTLAAPEGGLVPSDWDGALVFEALVQDEATAPATWDLQAELLVGAGRVAFKPDGDARFVPASDDDAAALRALASGASAGAAAEVRISAMPQGRDAATGGGRLRQALVFALRFAGRSAAPAPLEPMTVSFEDPEYNRRLATEPARVGSAAQALVDGQTVVRPFSVAADRREYNPESRLALLWDWDGPGLPDVSAGVEARAVSAAGVARPVAMAAALAPGTLLQLDLAAGGVVAEESLELLLTLTGGGAAGVALLRVAIVAEPVTPAPEAAYALLRSTRPGAVECARFAWGPAPARIELTSAADLRTELVRRRATFRWPDRPRVGRRPAYALQKIARDGATHGCTLDTTEES